MMAKKPKNALTLIEMIVALGMISLLIGLLLPAIQSARESSRRVSCQRNLMGIGKAVHQYINDYQVFPISIVSVDESKETQNFMSVHARLLPFMEQNYIYSMINFSIDSIPPENIAPSGRALDQQLTAMNTRLSFFICPSDQVSTFISANNYRSCSGVGPWGAETAETPDSGNGLLPLLDTVRIQSVTDGLSHTALMSERVLGTGSLDRYKLAHDFLNYPKASNLVFKADESVVACRIATTIEQKNVYVNSGKYWMFSGFENTSYNHAQVPNGRVPDCFHSSIVPNIGMSTARSAHPGGVNLLTGDGSVRFVTNGIAPNVWRGFATKDGGELID